MADTEKTQATPEITIQGVTVQIEDAFEEGHPLTAAQAHALNQMRRENIRNNLASFFRDHKREVAQNNGRLTKNEKGEDVGDDSQVTTEELDVDMLQAEVDKYAEDYEFGIRASGTPRAPADPVKREALAIATKKVKEGYAKKGYKISDVPAADIRALAEKYLEKYPQITEIAKAKVAATAKLDLEDLEV